MQGSRSTLSKFSLSTIAAVYQDDELGDIRAFAAFIRAQFRLNADRKFSQMLVRLLPSTPRRSLPLKGRSGLLSRLGKTASPWKELQIVLVSPSRGKDARVRGESSNSNDS